jgi:trans-4-hydroxy-L-proline dehydratase
MEGQQLDRRKVLLCDWRQNRGKHCQITKSEDVMEQTSAQPVGFSVWEGSSELPPRIKKLREEYWSYDTRDYFRNEVIPYTAGASWDSVYTPHERTIVPEFVSGLESVQDSLLAFAKKVDIPEGFWDEPIVVRHALFFERVLEHHPIFILDGELIIGGHFATSFSNCLNEEEAKAWRKEEDIFFAGVKKMIRLGVLNCGAVQGHIIPDHPSILKGGFAEVEGRARKIVEDCFGSKQRVFARAIMICCRAVKKFADRYARLAEKKAAGENDPVRKEELLNLSAICRRVPYQPARTFHEALQSIWFQHMLVLMAESYPGPGVSYGRMDQYLLPYYERDLREGRITRESAKELLCCFDIKHNYAYDHFGTSGGRQGITAGDGQLITLSGMGAGGKDLTNDLTYLILEAGEVINMLEPKINVRLHAKTPAGFLHFLMGQVSRAQGAPFLLNFDSMSIQALENAGISHEEAVNYGVVGCLENTSQGNDRSGTVDININLAKPVEWVLFKGMDALTGDQIGLATGDPLAMATFTEFQAAYLKQLGHLLRVAIELYNQADGLRARYEPVPYLSTMVRGCLESGRDVTQGGAKYNFVTIEGVGLATAADSLSAVKKLVFDDHKITMTELLQAVRDNFEGYEKLRLRLMNQAPKFGNDDPQADLIAREVSRFWSQEAGNYVTQVTGRRFRAGYLSWNYFISFARPTAATPDGRKRGEFLSNGIGPAQGMDRKGPTAAIKSVGSLGLDTVANGASYTPSFNPASLRDEEHREKFAALLQAYEKLGGTAMQINMVSPDMLREAQKHPEKYQNLLVRVTGYNAYFTMIGKALQDEIIARTVFSI